MQGCPVDIQTPTHWNPIGLAAPQYSWPLSSYCAFIQAREKWYDFIAFILKNLSSLGGYAPIIELRGLLLLTDAPVYAVRLISYWKISSRAVRVLRLISAPLCSETPLILLIPN